MDGKVDVAAEDVALRSRLVVVTFVGMAGVAAAVAAMPESQTVRRNLYGDRASCERDYSPAQCEPRGGGGGGVGGGRWMGPEYYEDRRLPEASRDPGPGRAGLAQGVRTSKRGGFGATGRFLRGLG